jgi:hypothetical protein
MIVAQLTFRKECNDYFPDFSGIQDEAFGLLRILLTADIGCQSLIYALINPHSTGIAGNYFGITIQGTKLYLGDESDDYMAVEAEPTNILLAIIKFTTYWINETPHLIIYKEGMLLDVQEDPQVSPLFITSANNSAEPLNGVRLHRMGSSFYSPYTAPIKDKIIWLLFELLQYETNGGSARTPIAIEDETLFWKQFKNVRVYEKRVGLRRLSRINGTKDFTRDEFEMDKDHLRELINTWDTLSLADTPTIIIQRNGERFTIKSVE